jgi:hypothetical protein
MQGKADAEFKAWHISNGKQGNVQCNAGQMQNARKGRCTRKEGLMRKSGQIECSRQVRADARVKARGKAERMPESKQDICPMQGKQMRDARQGIYTMQGKPNALWKARKRRRQFRTFAREKQG